MMMTTILYTSLHPSIHTFKFYIAMIFFMYSLYFQQYSGSILCFYVLLSLSLLHSFSSKQKKRARELTQPQPVYFSFLLLLKVYFSSLYLSLTLLYVIFLSLNQATNKEYTSAISTLYKPYGCFSVQLDMWWWCKKSGRSSASLDVVVFLVVVVVAGSSSSTVVVIIINICYYYLLLKHKTIIECIYT